MDFPAKTHNAVHMLQMANLSPRNTMIGHFLTGQNIHSVWSNKFDNVWAIDIYFINKYLVLVRATYHTANMLMEL